MDTGIDFIQEEGHDTSVGRRGEWERGRIGEREEERGRSDEPKAPLGRGWGWAKTAKVKF